MRPRALLALAAALVVACSGGSASPAPSAAPSTVTASASKAASSAANTEDVVVGGDRPVTVHVPPGYDPAKPAPLLILLHGYGSSGKEHDAYFHLGEEAARRGYLYADPDGTRNGRGDRFWDATDACCDFERSGVDDAAYLSGLITDIQATLAVDPKRIDLVGHSNGGFMSYAMSCAHADQVAAMVSLAGATFVDPADCSPTTPVAVLEIHGKADDTIAYAGGTIELDPGPTMAAYPGAETSVATWAAYDGCTASTVTDEHVDVDADFRSATGPAEASVARWTGCRPGGAAELWTMPGSGHAPTISDALPAAVLDFLDAHPKP